MECTKLGIKPLFTFKTQMTFVALTNLTPITFINVVILTGLFLPCAVSIGAEKTEEKNTINTQKSDHTDVNLLEENRLIQILIKINKNSKKITYEYEKINKEKELLEIELAKNIDEIKDISKKISTSKKDLVTRIKTIGQFSGENVLKMILMQPHLAAIEKNIKIMSYIASANIEQIQNYQKNKIILADKISKIKTRMEQFKHLQTKLENKKLSLESEYKKRFTFLNKIKNSKIFSKINIEKELSTGKFKNWNDLGIFDFLKNDSIYQQRGQLEAPVNGQIEQKFGYQNLEDVKGIKNNGVFVKAEKGSLVKSIFTGYVVVSGFIKGLGNYLILDHGDNYYSVYGNLKDIKVKPLDTLKKGQFLAEIDNQYIDNQQGLYFELRHYSKALNPKHWIGGWGE